MVDREARDRLIAAIDAYETELITSYDFNDRIFDGFDKIKDDAVNAIVMQLMCFVNEYEDTPIAVDKTGWDYIERMRLVLMSDADLVRYKVPDAHRSYWPRLIAGAALVAMGWLVYSTGFAIHLFVWGMPFGLLAVGLAWIWPETPDRGEPGGLRLSPFRTFAQLRALRKRTPAYRKRRPTRAALARAQQVEPSGRLPDFWGVVLATALGFVTGPMFLVMQLLEGSRYTWVVKDAHA